MRTAGPGRDDQDPDVDDRRSVGFVVERVTSEISRFVLFVRTGGSGRDQRDQEKIEGVFGYAYLVQIPTHLEFVPARTLDPVRRRRPRRDGSSRQSKI